MGPRLRASLHISHRLLWRGLVPRAIVDFLSWAVLVVSSGSVKEQGLRGWPLAAFIGMGFYSDKDCFCKSCFLGIIF